MLASSRGGPARVRIVRALDERPRNANQLAEALEMDYTTIRHHLDVLVDDGVVKRTDDDCAAASLFTEQTRDHWDIVEEIIDTVRGEP